MSVNVFDLQKKTCLSAVDLSRKGSVDIPVEGLIAFINDQNDFFTTSSCSGRIIVVDNDDEGKHKKQGCKWILTSHDSITTAQLREKLPDIKGNAVFKFEPFVLHVQCRTLEAAQKMLSSGVGSGYRNSGISVGNKGKFITSIRSTHSLEIPLSKNGQILVSDEYIDFIVDLANKKLKENFEKIERFFNTLKTSLQGTDKVSKKKSDRNQNLTEAATGTEVNDEEGFQVDGDRLNLGGCKRLDRHSEPVEDLVECAVFTCDLDT